MTVTAALPVPPVTLPHRPTLRVLAAPERSGTQRMEALGHANEVRTKRAQLKRDIKAGRASFVVVLLDPPAWLETAKVADILLAVPKYGRVKVNTTFSRTRISPSRTFGGLTDRQRAELLCHLSAPVTHGGKSRPSPLIRAHHRYHQEASRV